MKFDLSIKNPLILFDACFKEAKESGSLMDPTAMSLSTVGRDNKPSSRMVLLKKYNEKGFVFYTNYDSEKALDMSQNPAVALVFWWPSIHKQVRIEGEAYKISKAESDEYFAQRPRGSQLSAHVSTQSREIPPGDFLKKRYHELEKQFEHQSIPRPEHWGGYCVTPSMIEFWQEGKDRLHERLRFTLLNNTWQTRFLAP